MDFSKDDPNEETDADGPAAVADAGAEDAPGGAAAGTGRMLIVRCFAPCAA